MNNPYIGKTWVDRDSEYPTRRILTDTTTLETQQVPVTRAEGTITDPGDAFDAYNMNNFESRINTAFAALAACGFTLVSGTLVAGSTSITLSDASITTNSIIFPLTDTYGIFAESVVATTGSVTLTFEAQESNLGVKVMVY